MGTIVFIVMGLNSLPKVVLFSCHHKDAILKPVKKNASIGLLHFDPTLLS
jgi:hypothetical protein